MCPWVSWMVEILWCVLCVRACVRLSHLNLLEGHGGVVHQVPGPVHLTELAPPNLLLNLEVSQRVVAHVRLKRLLQGRHRQHTVTHVGLHPWCLPLQLWLEFYSMLNMEWFTIDCVIKQNPSHLLVFLLNLAFPVQKNNIELSDCLCIFTVKGIFRICQWGPLSTSPSIRWTRGYHFYVSACRDGSC